jgi:DNA-binding response OmpR family regulator
MTGDESLAGTRGPGPDYADAETLIKPFQTEDLLAVITKLMGNNKTSKKNTKTVQLDI